MKKTIILFFSINLLFFSCNKQEKSDHESLIKELPPIDMHSKWTELFTGDYEITPLETRPECLIGEIRKIRKFQDEYYIASSNGASIFHFNRNGEFINKLGKLGSGPEEYLRIEDFDVYNINGEKEIWIADNQGIKIYQEADGAYIREIRFPSIIYRFKRIENDHILLVTGQDEYILTLADSEGKVLSNYLKREIPFIMFRPVQFVKNQSEYLYQLGISNRFVAFDTQTEQFRMGRFVESNRYLSDRQLLELFQVKGQAFIIEANQRDYINNIVTLDSSIWIQTHQGEKNFLTKIEGEKAISTVFSYGTFLSTLSDTESDESILLYMTADQAERLEYPLFDKFGNEIKCEPEDNPLIWEFKNTSSKDCITVQPGPGESTYE